MYQIFERIQWFHWSDTDVDVCSDDFVLVVSCNQAMFTTYRVNWFEININWKMTETEEYKCVNCGKRAAALYRTYGPTVLKLTKCVSCLTGELNKS